MLIPFDILKVAQAGAVLLKTEPEHRMSRLRLLKLLYIADRESLQERARPITGDSVAAMDHGPVLSHTYDLIKGADFNSPAWQRYIRSAGRDVTLVGEPGVGRLTRYEIGKLQDVAARFAQADDWAVAEHTHTFAEWQRNQPARGSARRVPLSDLLDATGLADQSDELLRRERAEAAAARLFGGGCADE